MRVKEKRKKVNYVDSDEEIEEYDDDVRDKTYSPGKDKGSDDKVDDDKGGDDTVLYVKPLVKRRRIIDDDDNDNDVDEHDKDKNVEIDNDYCNVKSDEDSSHSEDESDRTKKKDSMKTYLEENHISVPLSISRRVRDSNQYIINLKRTLEAEVKPPASIRNTILSTVKIMYFFAPGYSIDLFHPSHLTDVQKVTDFFKQTYR